MLRPTAIVFFRFRLPVVLIQECSIVAKNVFGEDLLVCSADPLTGFFRTGKCETCGDDHGMHTVCAVMTAEFLQVFKERLATICPRRIRNTVSPACNPVIAGVLCLPRWIEALEAGFAPQLALRATHISAIEHLSMEVLLKYAVDADGYVYEPPTKC